MESNVNLWTGWFFFHLKKRGGMLSSLPPSIHNKSALRGGEAKAVICQFVADLKKYFYFNRLFEGGHND